MWGPVSNQQSVSSMLAVERAGAADDAITAGEQWQQRGQDGQGAAARVWGVRPVVHRRRHADRHGQSRHLHF